MKKEKRDILKKFRYFKIFEECYIDINGDTIPLKKGDIIKIYNSQLEDLVFNKTGGILWDINYDQMSDFKLEKYPEDKPFNVVEYIKMQPNFQLNETTSIGSWISSDSAIYLTPKIIDRMLNDNKNSIRFSDGSTENVSTYNKRNIINFDGKLDYMGKGFKMIGSGGKSDDKGYINEIEATQKSEKNLSLLMARIKPGLYKTKSSFLPLEFFLEKGEIIDFSKPEYTFLTVNQRFMEALGKSVEITSIKKKSKIYDSEQRDFLPKTRTRYYRLKDDVNVKSLTQLQYMYMTSGEVQEIGHNFNRYRVKGNLEVVDEENGRISVIKIDYENPAVYGIVDRELRKVSKRLNRKEAVSMHLQEVSRKQRKNEEELVKKAARKGKDYFRTKMIADLARIYIDEGSLTNEFRNEAFRYYEKHKKAYWDTWETLGQDSNFNWDDFYMMHLIRNEKRDNRLIDAAYKQKLQEKRNSLINVLGNIPREGKTER